MNLKYKYGFVALVAAFSVTSCSPSSPPSPVSEPQNLESGFTHPWSVVKTERRLYQYLESGHDKYFPNEICQSVAIEVGDLSKVPRGYTKTYSVNGSLFVIPESPEQIRTCIDDVMKFREAVRNFEKKSPLMKIEDPALRVQYEDYIEHGIVTYYNISSSDKDKNPHVSENEINPNISDDTENVSITIAGLPTPSNFYATGVKINGRWYRDSSLDFLCGFVTTPMNEEAWKQGSLAGGSTNVEACKELAAHK